MTPVSYLNTKVRQLIKTTGLFSVLELISLNFNMQQIKMSIVAEKSASKIAGGFFIFSDQVDNVS